MWLHRAGQVDLCPMRLDGGIRFHPGFVRSERSKTEMEQTRVTFLNPMTWSDSFISNKIAVDMDATYSSSNYWPLDGIVEFIKKH
ncbi:hypothetical protein NC653_000481 [Populus alba x Populus x berolinensis]|uniref:Uncharacterized protein n=1 Tax=Populus alba x Populus x berolinensis TaxID=444605 RepID=A0AAD6RIT5_9ROSI|nr:hypothetical protein NC653_000481 [Populus alba x Populus x berolinensis]